MRSASFKSPRRSWLALTTSVAVVLGTVGAFAPPASAAPGDGWSSADSAHTALVGGVLYARQDASLTLKYSLSPTPGCLSLTGAINLDPFIPPAGTTSWTFSATAPAGSGSQSVTITPRGNHGGTPDRCNGNTPAGQATYSYSLDNTGPTVTHAVSPAPTGAGWNNSDVTVSWTATDAGSGVATQPPNTVVMTDGTNNVSASARDRVGNSGSDSATVRIDRAAPSVTGSRSPAANGFGWNNGAVTVIWACQDQPSSDNSGLNGSCPAPSVISGEGTNQTATSPSVADLAGNSSTGSLSGISIDNTAPTLSGAASGPGANAAGWYKNDVTIHWTSSDVMSGIDPSTVPADSVLTGEGNAVSTSASVSDKAGNSKTAMSAPVKIDRTAPATTASAPPSWTNADAAVTLTATDGLSGVASTSYSLDGGAVQTGTNLTIASEGDHTLSYWSADNAGNVEETNTVHIKVDKTAPSITSALSPVANAVGWNKSDVTVTFTCADNAGGSGVATCSGPHVVTTEGAAQSVPGSATDNAGNNASTTATVNLDKTAPSVVASLDRGPDSNGWYNHAVTTTFACNDGMSGIPVGGCPASVTRSADGAHTVNGQTSDTAGNLGSDSVTFKIDATPPLVTGSVVSTPNANGWHKGTVTIHWTCADAGSGLAATCPGDTTLSSEGADQIAVSPDVFDNAGNSSHGTVSGIDIDTTAPHTTAAVPAPLESGWYASAVPVTLHASDATSGVATTFYAIDNGATHTYAGTFNFGTGGVHSIAFWSADNADNAEDATNASQTITLKLDDLPPSISGVRLPAPNGGGWNNTDVNVTFTCSDGESDIVSCGPDKVLSNNGADQSVSGIAEDQAGNTASATVDGINIDKVAPTLSGAPSTPANAQGWYHSDVTINWTPADTGGSGVDFATAPASVLIGDEGVNLTRHAFVSDVAGNSVEADSLPVKIDKTNPTIAGSILTPHSATDWYNTDVVVAWTCADDRSGIASCPANSTIAGEGTDLFAGGTAVDNADNSASTTVEHVSIDRTAPSTTATAPNGWNKDNVAVTLNASDNLSLVAATHYQVAVGGGVFGAVQDGTSVTFDTDGVYTLKYWSVDNAGNIEAPRTVEVKVDKTAPSISHDFSIVDGDYTATPNGAGWFNMPVTVRFICADGLSGIASCSAPVLVDQDGLSIGVPGTAVDNAGNTSTDPVTVNLDTAKPSISGAPDRAANANDWYDADVTVSFTCTDGASGIAACTAPETLGEGDGQSVSGDATDQADNTNHISVGGINIDKTAPSLTGAVIAPPNGNGWYRSDVTVAWNCDDALSGIEGDCPSNSIVDGAGSDLGASRSVFDRAGNRTDASVNGIKIDRTAPQTQAVHAATPVSGWFTAPVDVTLSANDVLSGIDQTWFAVDAGAPQVYSAPFMVGEGIHVIHYWSRDLAGNTEADNTQTIQVDSIAPSISAHATPAANAHGWRKDAVTVTFTCTDAGSGIVDCPAAATVPGPALDETVSGTATDAAGNSATASIAHVRVDQDAPALAGTPSTTSWVNHPVTVTWQCSDLTSGIDGACPDPSVVDGEGDNLGATESVTDNAGNVTTQTVSGIRIDHTDPVTTAIVPATWVNSDVAVTLVPSDPASGVASTHYRVNGGTDTKGTSISLGEGTWHLEFWSVDVAGNVEAVNTATVLVDKTRPTISHELNPQPNAGGWNNSNVTVTFHCGDEPGGSDVASCTSPATVAAEGAAQKVTGTATDNAGNSASDTATVNLDRTPPTISGAPDRAADSNGWYNHDVVVNWTCNDNLSGVHCPDAATLSQNHASVTDTATDGAGNESTTTVGPLQVDETAPTISGSASATDWVNHDVTVTWTCGDALSGVAAGDCPVPTVIHGEGDDLSETASVHDRAGNVASATVSGIRIDRNAPITDASVIGTSFNGWYVPIGAPSPSPTVLLSTSSDLSGIAVTRYQIDGGTALTYTGAFAVAGGVHSVSYWSVDNAGNTESAKSMTVRVDNIAPTATGATTTAPNANGWFNSDVAVAFTCGDAQTGIQSCGPDAVLTAEGSNLGVTGVARDQAGNTKSVTVSGINIDKTMPVVNIGGVSGGTAYVMGSVPTPTCSASDSLSGLAAPCQGSLNTALLGGDGTGVVTFTASATDRAGNTTSVSASYSIVFKFGGFLQPVTNTAHDKGTASVFKGNSTVPLKFQLTNSVGSSVTPSTAPYVVSLVQSGAMNGSTAVASFSSTGTVGASFKLTSDQWQYNFSTKGLPTGYYYTLSVRLSDGTTKQLLLGIQ